MSLVFELAELIVKIIIRSKFSGDVSDTTIDFVGLLKKAGLDEYTSRSVDRQFGAIVDDVAQSCEKLLAKAGVKGHEREKIIKQVCVAYQNAGLDIDAILKVGINEERLRRKVLELNPAPDSFTTTDMKIFERLIANTTHIIIEGFIRLPEFTNKSLAILCSQMDNITDKFSEILKKMEKLDEITSHSDGSNDNFELTYRQNIITQNNYVNLFGAGNINNYYKRYPLSIAYVELELMDLFGNNAINLKDIFKYKKNIWISGDAGLGKTTLLQWIAVKVAEGGETIGVKGIIPIIMQLRKFDCNNLSLKDSVEAVMKDSSYRIPEGWIEETMNAGHFMFLIDGFDEISEEDRKAVLNWLGEIDPKNKCKKIYTARPQVKIRPKPNTFIEVNILPMDRKRIKKFVDYWHMGHIY